MFIDYLALMLVNLVAGFALLAYYLVFGVDDADQGRWSAGFGVVGLIGFATGLHMILTWPLPGGFNVAFGEPAILFGALFLIGAIALAFRAGLLGVAFTAVFAGIYAIIVGAKLIAAGLTQEPIVAGIGFIVSGIAAVLLWPAFLVPSRVFKIVVAIIAVIAALIWAFVGFPAVWDHISSFAKWVPFPLRK